MIYSCMTLRTLNDRNYGIFLLMGNAGFISSTVGRLFAPGALGPGSPRGRGLRHAWCSVCWVLVNGFNPSYHNRDL